MVSGFMLNEVSGLIFASMENNVYNIIMNVLGKILSLFCFILFLDMPLFGQEQTYKLVSEIWPPFRIKKSESPCSGCGIDMDLLLELEMRMDIHFDITFCPWSRALEKLKTGQADIIAGIAYTEERNQFAFYVHPSYAAVKPVFYTKSKNGSDVQSYSDLTGKTIGLSRDSAYFDPFNSDSSLNKVYLKTEKNILDMLAIGRIDLAVGTNPNMAFDVARYGYRDRLEPTDYQPENPTNLFLAISRKSRLLGMAGLFEETLNEMLADGTMDEILNKYK